MKTTVLAPLHIEKKALMVDFAGWQMPLHYGSQLQEHETVRKDAGIFDVSHMGIIDIEGKDACKFLARVMANDVTKLTEPGLALYSCMLNHNGGVMDDLIIYFLKINCYRLVVNAATAEKDWAWLQGEAKNFHIQLNQRNDFAIIAIQGPKSREKLALAYPDLHEILADLKSFQIKPWGSSWVAATGYTGEDGVEVIIPVEAAVAFWQRLLEKNFQAIGLGARDTLRLEAGFNLYDQDMDENVTPLESNLNWTIPRINERDFIGRDALQKQKKSGLLHQLVGLILLEKGVLRAKQVVVKDELELGLITSGSFSPILQRGIALARLKLPLASQCQVLIRGKAMRAQICQPPFVKNGQAAIQLNNA